jgi:hypothetical protein
MKKEIHEIIILKLIRGDGMIVWVIERLSLFSSELTIWNVL